MKKILAGALLGVALLQGNSFSLHAEAENITEEFAATDENSSFEAELEVENDEAGFYGENDEIDFFGADGFESSCEEEPKEMLITSEPSEAEKILAGIPADAKSVVLDAEEGSDITERLNTVLEFMGKRATDAQPCTVVIPPGNYQLSGTVCMYSNLTLDASGAVLTKTCTDKHVILRLGTDVNSGGGYEGYRNIVIKGGTWDFNYQIVENKESPGGFVGFRIGHARNVTIKDVTFLNNLKSHFLEIAGVKDVVVSGCTFRGYWPDYEGGGQECIQLDACLDYIFPGYQPFDGAVCENVLVENNIFEDVFAGVGSHSMIYDCPYRNIVIRGNTFRNVRKRAVWCLNYVDSVVEDNMMENVGGGILVSNMYFANTYLAPGAASGVEGNHQESGIVVQRNQISVSSVNRINNAVWKGYGIQVQGTRVTTSQSTNGKGIPAGLYKETGAVVSDNVITGTCNGIRVYLADNCKLLNNRLDLQRTAGFSGMGIYLSASSGNTVSGNQVSGCKNVGIYAYDGGSLNVPSKENLIQGNTVSGTGGDGILLESGCDSTVINKNCVLSGKKNGIIVWGSQNCEITSNQVSDCALSGIYLENVGKAVIKSNKITKVNGRGIQVIGSQVKSLYRNIITGCKKCGLYVSQSGISGNKKNRMEKNGSTYAIYAEDSTGIISVKLPTISRITRNSVKVTGKAAGGKKLTIYSVRGSKNKRIGKGTINSKKKYSVTIKKQKKGTVLRFVLSDKYGNISYTNKKVK